MTAPGEADPRYDGALAALRGAGCVFAEEEAELLLAASSSGADLAALIARRVGGEPLEHVLGRVDFAGLQLAVGPGVFVPRRRTELVSELAVRFMGRRPGRVMVDVCCGCGAVAAAAASRLPGAEVHASDIDAAAVDVARVNLAPYGASVHVGDLMSAVPQRLRHRVDVLVANAPYVPTAGIRLMPAEARDHEPRSALDGGPDGLGVLTRIVALAPDWLAPGGTLVVECAPPQLAALAGVARSHGMSADVVTDDDRDATALVVH